MEAFAVVAVLVMLAGSSVSAQDSNIAWTAGTKICVGAKDQSPGIWVMPKTGVVKAVKLVHDSGFVNCLKSEVGGRSNFGCNLQGRDYAKQLGIIITDVYKARIFPPAAIHLHHGWFYYYPGYLPNSPEIVFTDFQSKTVVNQDDELRIWYSEDLTHHHTNDNEGTTCMIAYALIE